MLPIEILRRRRLLALGRNQGNDNDHGSSVHFGFAETPEARANEQIRQANTLNQETQRKQEIADRLAWRDEQVKRGVPNSLLIPASRIAQGVNAQEWADHKKALSSFNVPGASAQSAGDAEPGQMRRTGAGLVATVDSGTDATGVPRGVGVRQVAVTPNAEQAMSLATGGKWDTMSVPERTAELRRRAGLPATPNPYAGTISAPDDASRIVNKYAPKTNTASAPPQDETPGAGLPTQLTPIGAATAATPSPAAVAAQPSDVLSGIPPTPNFSATVAGARPPQTLPSGAPVDMDITTGAPPSPLQRAGQAVGRGYRAVADTVASIPGAVRDLVGKPIVNEYNRAAGSVGNVVKGVEQGAGRTTEAGVTNATASQFEQPTAKNGGVPVTPTTPVDNVDKGQMAIASFGGDLGEDWKKNRELYAGF